MMWAMLDTASTPQVADVLPVADVMWDALKIIKLEDIRPISTNLRLPRMSKFSDGAKSIAQMTPILVGAGFLFAFWLEDFNRPTWLSDRYVQTSPTVEPGILETSIRKIGDGLDKSSTYVGRPVPVRPHSAVPYAIRIVPIEPGRGFTLRIRVMTGAGTTWSRWFWTTDLTGPQYTLFLSTIGPAPLRKWQVVVHGECSAIVVTYLTVTADPGAGLVYDSGVFDEGSFL
jgi:hypothetical protein